MFCRYVFDEIEWGEELEPVRSNQPSVEAAKPSTSVKSEYLASNHAPKIEFTAAQAGRKEN